MKPTAPVSTAPDHVSQGAGVAGPAEIRRLERLVEEFIGETFGLAPGEASSNARFGEDIGVDSFDLLELAMAAQARFGTEIRNAALAEVETVGDFSRCVIDEMLRGRKPRHWRLHSDRPS